MSITDASVCCRLAKFLKTKSLACRPGIKNLQSKGESPVFLHCPSLSIATFVCVLLICDYIVNGDGKILLLPSNSNNNCMARSICILYCSLAIRMFNACIRSRSYVHFTCEYLKDVANSKAQRSKSGVCIILAGVH